METVVANLSAAKPRRERLHGRDWLVASAALIVPDRVLNGSNGPGWYPAEECGRNPQVWNHVPLVLWHPTNERGEHVSARHPSVLANAALGTIYSTGINVGGTGKLISEAWFDVQLVKNADERHKGRAGFPLLPRIEAGQPIELSTGLEPRYDRTKGVTNDGVAYDWIARDFKPDHVAVLPDMRGACSVADGCGINVNTFCATGEGGGVDPSCGGEDASGDFADELAEKFGVGKYAFEPKVLREAYQKSLSARTVQEGGGGRSMILKVETSSPPSSKLKEAMFSQLGGSIQDVSDRSWTVVSSTKTSHEGAARWVSSLVQAGAFVEKSGVTNPIHRRPTTNDDHDDGEHHCELCQGKPESEHCDECKAEKAVANLLNAGKYGNPQSTATGRFKWMGAGTGKGEAHDAAQQGFMNISDAQRERAQVAAAEALQGRNPPSWAADEGKWDRAKQIVEEKMPDCDDYYACAAYVYDHIGGVVNQLEGITVNQEDTDMPLTKKEAVTFLTANCDCWKGQEAVLNSMSDEQLAKHYQHVQSEVKQRKEHEAVVNRFKAGVKLGTGGAVLVLNSAGKPVVRNAEHGDEECDPEDKECLAMMEGKKKESPIGNAVNVDPKQIEASIAKGLGFESIDHARAVLNSAKQVNEEAKHKIVTRLVANVADDAKRNQLGNSLMRKDLAELKELALLAPPEQPVQPERPAYNFAPAASGFGGSPTIFNDGGEDEELLDLPVMNWRGEEKAKATA